MAVDREFDIGPIIKQRREAMGLSQEDVAEAARTSQTTIDRMEKNQFKRTPSALPAVARVLKLDLAKLMPDLAEAGALPARVAYRDGEIPVFGPVQGGEEGAEILTSDPIDVLRPPHALMSTRGGYGVLVTGDSMEPALRPGDIALVNPNLPLRVGGEVILQRSEHGAKFGIVKTLLSFTPTEWRLRQWNPKRDFTKSRKDWPDCHAVIGKSNR